MKTALIFCALLVPAVGAAQSMTAEDFIRQAAEDNIAQVEAGRMAQGTNSLPLSVQQLGRQSGADAVRRNEALAKLAAARNVALANQISAADRSKLERLSKQQGHAFTRDYLRMVLDDLDQDRALFQVATGLDDAEVAQFAKDALPGIEKEMQVARAIYDSQAASMAPHP